MQRKITLFLYSLFLSTSFLGAQFIDHIGENDSGSFFGVRGGFSLGSQNWSGFEMRPLIAYHGDIFIETLPEEGRFGLWASLGYHTRGSRLQTRRVFDINGNSFNTPSQTFEFYNLSLAVGAKQVFTYSKTADFYYTLGLRLDYTLDTNLDSYDNLDNTQGIFFRQYYPFEDYNFVRRLNYGISAGGGVDIPLSDKIGVNIQLTAHPDFSLQYNQPAIENIISPFTSNNTTLRERSIRNFTLELSAGFRFLRKIEYID